MEDAATAEISRAQVWQWAHHQVTLAGPDKTMVTKALVPELLDETVEKLAADGTYDRRPARARPAMCSSKWRWPTTSRPS